VSLCGGPYGKREVFHGWPALRSLGVKLHQLVDFLGMSVETVSPRSRA
jgi:hypothetical protein